MRQNLRKRKPRLVMRAAFLALCALIFVVPTMAQQTNIYMKDGNRTIQRGDGVINFYDSHGPSQQTNYWETWYSHNENFTYVFKPAVNGDKIKVTFKPFAAYAEPADPNSAMGDPIGNWTLRLNDDVLTIYNGNGAVDANIIAELTGNTQQGFSVMTDGPITFKFVSNSQYREEGWYATVELVQGNMAPQVPLIQRSTCSDQAEIFSGTYNARIIYSIGDNDPAPGDPLAPPTYEYTGPISFPEETIPSTGFKVNAMSQLAEGGAWSSVTHAVFQESDRVPIPDADDELAHTTITREDGTNTIIMTPAGRPTGLNDTYEVRYTMSTNGTAPAEPTYNNSTLYTGPITATVNGTIFKAKTFAKSCHNQCSAASVPYVVDGIYAPAPVIDFNAMTITAAEGTTTFDILYTLDGSIPSVDPETGAVTGTYSAGTVSLTGLTPGQTVLALAYRANNDSGHTANLDYTPSQVVAAVYVPSSGSGSYGTIVLLDDREDHTWSYYKNAEDLPTGYPSSLSSPDPRNVKITYKGNGQLANGNAASGVQVGLTSEGETENTFIFLKTLEKGTDGKYAYRVLPNPFYVRPKVGNTYYGFSHWKVSSITGGTIDGNPTTINGDTEIKFNPTSSYTVNGMSMEVVLEAVWDVAEVSTSGTFTNDYGVERMFYIVSDAQTSNLSRVNNKAVTYTSFYPNGTTNGTTAASLSNRNRRRGSFGNTNPNADVKIEYLILTNNNSTLTSNAYNMTIGRGVSASTTNGLCASNLYGLVQNSSTTRNFTMRIESGSFNHMYFLGYGRTYTGKLTVVLGSDYDRAKTDDTKLKALANGNTRGDICAAFSSTLGSQSSIGTEVFNCTVKSGNFDLGLYGGSDAQFYISSPGSSNVYGSRKLLVEGGVFADIVGGIDYNGETNAQNIGDHLMTDIRIKGGTIKGVVYGAAQKSKAGGHRRFVFTGGVCNGWIAGGCNGTETQNGELYGDTYIYFGGKAITQHRDNDPNMNASKGGNIFGAGSGISGGTTVGQVYNSSVVVADNATVERDVYGGGNYGYVNSGTGHKTDMYVLGGTVGGSVFGGSNQQQGQIVNILMEDGTITGNIYGGSNTTGTVNGLATINVSGGTVSNIFGGGYGSSTIMSDNTRVTVTGGTINNNVYGGGEEGDVSGNTIVNFEGGSVTDIFGAGKGTSSNVAQGTTVNVKGGLVNGSVYGGGENGTVAYNGTSYGSTVSVSGGEVKVDVFGGGMLGTTNGPTTVNISGTWDGTVIRGNVFAGAYGSHGSIYVAGLKTLNISGGRTYGSVYGGSRNANDANTLSATFEGSNETATTSVVNISGGRVDQHVYAAGYYGNSVGSVYAFIGLSAINDAPHHSKTTGFSYDKGSILIGGSVWAGGDWGVFTGSFGAPTISGNSNIYINGEGYSTDGNDQSAANYMNLQSSILGCGTSCDAGAGERVLILSHYGADVANSGADSGENPFAYASRQVNSIQRFHNVIFDDAHLGFLGLGKINSLGTTEKYALYEIDQNVYLANGSTMVMNVPSSQIYSFHSVTIDDAYNDAASAYHVVNYDGLGAPGSATDNKIRVNGGSYVEIRYIPEGEPNGVIPTNEPTTTTYDFEDGTSQGWSWFDNDGDNSSWIVSNALSSNNTVQSHGGDYYTRSTYNANAAADNWLISPQIRLGGSISFYVNRLRNSNYDDFYRVYVSTTGTSISDFTEITTQAIEPTFDYVLDEYDLSSYSGNGYVAIRHISNIADQAYIFLDDITITEPAASTGEDPEPVYYAGYGQLEGFAHMMAGNPDEDATCAYARPKQSTETGNILLDENVFNTSDGGWVSYDADENEYDANGGLVGENQTGVQLRYENHHPNMRDNSEYYRIWRKGGNHYTLEAVVTAHAEGTNTYKTVEVEVELPSWGAAGSYYRFDRTNNPGVNNTLIDYGSDVMTFNGANYSNPLGAETWMYFDSNSDQQVTGVTASNATVAAAIGQNGILSNPNLNFGLVIEPGLTMKSTDVNYIINSESDSYLASVEKPFNCQDNTHKPTVKLVLTYSDKLSANATLDPVLITLVQCDAQGNITDYVTIKLIIVTSMNLTSGFTTQIYARMDGSANIRETSMVPVVLPTFNVAESGENAEFYLQSVEFIQNDGVVLEPAAHGSSVICAETRESASSSGTQLNIDRFAMTIGALANPDNTDDWRNVSGPQDAVQQPNNGYGTLIWGGSNNRGVHLGDGKGRNPLSFAITMYFNSNEEAPGKSKMGDMVFTIEATNVDGGTGTNSSITFTITVEVYRLGPGENFYVDGIHGQDLDDADRAKFPDKSAKTINFIFNRLGYMPGDNIFVVDELPINKTITWDGSKFQNNVKIYRYPGGHKLTTGGTTTETNQNLPYLGPLVDVTKTLNMKGVIMDGMYAESTAPLNGVHNPKLYPTGDAGACTYDGIANAPLITISNGGRANLTNTTLQNNYNNKTEKVNAGGAVHVTYEGILAMNDKNRITANYNTNGGGVYVDGSMIVSDYAYVFDNYKEAVSGSKANPEQNNVMLEDVTEGSFRVVQLGTSDANDAYDELLQTDDEGETKIGVTKDDWDHAYDGYMPVTFAESGSLSYLNDPYNTQSMVVHDGNIFKLERYVSSEYSDSPNYLYWLGTWVTAVTWNPYFTSREAEGYTNYFTDAQLKDIHTPEQLAWAISIVNGENYCTPQPNTSFTLTDDIDMAANIWVPIGNETALYNGTFEGNGHVVTGLRGSITRTDMGMFGRTDANANIQNMVVSTKFNTNSDNLGTVVGNMTGGTLSNVEGAGENTSRNSAGNNGGLVGINSGTIHSCFSVATIKGGNNVGGLVAVNSRDLFNSYSAADISEGVSMAGLVAINNGRVENCYDATNAAIAFAVENNNTIRYCYTAEADENETITYVKFPGDEATFEKYGTYGAVKGIKEIGYMYGDNKITAAANQTIGYVKTTHEYLNGHTVVWDGLLSVLNQWVADGNIQGKPSGLSTWNRPLTQALNGDLPVLAFPKDNCLGNLAAEDGKMLYYSAYNLNPNTQAGETFNNGLDHLLGDIYDGKAANIFLYNNTKDVENGTVSNKLFINEDAALIQKATNGNMPEITATVGVTFDNSCKSAQDYWGHQLAYDWHMMSTPLKNAKMGTKYNEYVTNMSHSDPALDWSDVKELKDSYFPNGLLASDVAWDFYTYFEPQYHWINFKRDKENHFHFDLVEGVHANIEYTGLDQGSNDDESAACVFTPGKGYMMAISQDTYMSSNGILNTGGETIEITNQEPDDIEYNKGWNLVGNPYQAYLDLTKVSSTMNQFYIYDAEQGTYVPYTVDQSANSVTPSRFIHPHQAFFVYSAAASSNYVFDYTWATAEKATDGSSYFRGGENQLNYPLVNLFVKNQQGNRDLTIIEFNRPELGGATKVRGLRNSDFRIAAGFNGREYGILFTPEGTEKVPVHFKAEHDGIYTMTWGMENGNFTNLRLIDNKTGVNYDMLANDSYTFEASADDYASRFYITYTVTGLDEEISYESDNFAFFNGSEWIINGQGHLDVIDMTGRVLYAAQLSNDQNKVNLDGFAKGVYLLRVIDNKVVRTQKIIVR